MSLKIKIEVKAKAAYLLVTVTGAFDVKQAKAGFSHVMKACVRRRLSKVLIDATGLAGNLSAVDRFEFSAYVTEQQLDIVTFERARPPRIAVVTSEPPLDPEIFGGTVARSRSAIYKVTPEIGEALRWLEVGEAA